MMAISSIRLSRVNLTILSPRAYIRRSTMRFLSSFVFLLTFICSAAGFQYFVALTTSLSARDGREVVALNSLSSSDNYLSSLFSGQGE